ncbi:MAG: TolC family protein [Dysgonamonadaceae bacterium]|nr:TolC family protein [Dysgonamonadaceae bacterium]
MELENEINELQTALNEQQKTLKSLLNVEPLVRIEIVKDTIDRISPDKLSLITLLETAAEQRPDLKRQQLETEYHQKSLIYEKSLRTPDITLSANYDRYGGVWQDFIGLGVSMDLPLFNRNQGNIKAARINIEKSQYLLKQQTNLVRYEISENFDNYVRTYRFHEKISENDLLSELDDMLDAYTKNLLNKNISMLEYLDFMEAYKNNKQTMLLSEKNLQTSFEELQYSIGGEIR